MDTQIDNIFLIVLDSVRRDYFSERMISNLVELKNDFVNFKNCNSIYTSTFLSHYTIFFGDYLYKSKIESFPFQLKKLGFNIKSFCNGAITLGYPLEKSISSKNIPSRSKIIDDWGIETEYQWEREHFGNKLEDYYGAADDENNKISDKWISFLNKNKSNKNYLFLHFWQTHHNYGINDFLQEKITGKNYLELGTKLIDKIINKEITTKFVKKVYYQKIEEILNNYISLLIQNLKDNKIYDESLIIITSDHGEGLADIGRYYNKKLFYLYNFFFKKYNFFRRKYKILPNLKKLFNCMWDSHTFLHNGDYDLQREIPLLIKFPKNKHGGTKFNGKVTLFDIIHTLNDLLDNKIDIENNNGCSLYALLGEDKSIREKYNIQMNIKKIISSGKI